ncbi:Catalase-rel domain containing protein, partial [Asbolus verrucosus]
HKRSCHTTSNSGIPLVKKDVSITVGSRGPIVLYDTQLFEQLAHFGRERIPERVVHAKGAGAFGYFEVTDDITDYTVSKVFDTLGKMTPIAVRFSQVAGNLGSADTVRDVRGFAVKFYTEEGIWDLVGNNTPIFFVRDPKLFPMFIHSQKRNPSTNIMRDWNMFWDFLSLTPQSVHQVLVLFSDRGIPDGHRHMHGYGSHTFSLINENRKVTWVKFHYKTDQGIKNLPPGEADRIAGTDPDYALRDLYNAIAKGNFPSWTLYIQTMTPKQAEECPFDPFDITKTWPQKQFPLKRVGKIILNRNPVNFFAEIEQLAFSAANLTPGIGASPDRFLQGRLFSYDDTHRYRLGVNYQQLPVNCPFRVCNFQRDGLEVVNNQGAAPNYHPNSFGGPEVDPGAASWTAPPRTVSGEMNYFDRSDEDNYSQARTLYKDVLDDGGRARLIENLADTLKLTKEKIRNRAIANFAQVDNDFADRLKQKIRQKLAKL